MRRRALAAALAVGLLAAPGAAAAPDEGEGGDPAPVAAQRPLWEAGIAAGTVTLSTYAGASTRRYYTAASPYIVYRGRWLRATGRAVRVVFFEGPRLWSDLSGGGWLPVGSRDDPARAGMPRLDLTVQAGPRVNYLLARGARGEAVARLAVRAVWSVAGLNDISPRGWVWEPELSLLTRVGRRVSTGVTFSALFGDAEQNGYFYDVPAAYATPARPAFRSGAGLVSVGAHLWVGWNVTPSLRLGTFVDLKTLSGSVVEGSPLVSRDEAVSAGVGLVWVLARSERLVTGRGTDGR